MTALNLDWRTGAAYYGDCADVMAAWREKGMRGVADLIYGDPPFNSNRNYGSPTSKSKESDTGSMDAFTDMWTYDDKAFESVNRICKTSAHPACELIGGLRGYLEKTDDGMLAYLPDDSLNASKKNRKNFLTKPKKRRKVIPKG